MLPLLKVIILCLTIVIALSVVGSITFALAAIITTILLMMLAGVGLWLIVDHFSRKSKKAEKRRGRPTRQDMIRYQQELFLGQRNSDTQYRHEAFQEALRNATALIKAMQSLQGRGTVSMNSKFDERGHEIETEFWHDDQPSQPPGKLSNEDLQKWQRLLPSR
jgi:ABC-type transport system involved in cytochrome bd biosynthesis fused ATPase/permease subunit